MSRRTSTGAALVAAALALAALAAAATGAAQYKSSITLGASLTGGKVSSPKNACLKERKVAVKYTDARGKTYVFGRDTTNANGAYQVTPGATPGKLPFKFKAHVGPLSTRSYTCQAADSKVRVVSGG